jgi:hypothetical protein
VSRWRALQDEGARWQDTGRSAQLWWRDDDAGAIGPAIERLLVIAERHGVPLALAVVPAVADSSLIARLGPGVSLLQHGTDHRDRAAPGEKKTEFPAAEPAADALARLAGARKRLAQLAAQFSGIRLLPVLAPPWNRLADALIPQLAGAGYRGLSRYGPRKSVQPGLREVNTHVDLVAWRGDRAFVGEAAALDGLLRQLAARRTGEGDAAEPVGLLTHHAVHDQAAWCFLERLLETVSTTPGLRWRAAQELFPE